MGQKSDGTWTVLKGMKPKQRMDYYEFRIAKAKTEEEFDKFVRLLNKFEDFIGC